MADQHIDWEKCIETILDSKESIYDLGQTASTAGKSMDTLTKEIEILIKTSGTWKDKLYSSGEYYSECDFFSKFYNEPMETRPQAVLIEAEKPPLKVLNRFSGIEID